jgi:ribosomal protein S18 acetylase RimI-like enzyme
MGITASSFEAEIRAGEVFGHVCTDNDAVIGYCFGDRHSGEVVVLALLPDYEFKGIGRALLSRVGADFRQFGFKRLFLGCATDPATRSFGFYRHLGWRSTHTLDKAGDEVLEYHFALEQALAPGNYWKTPFIWEPACASPAPAVALTFEAAPEDWLAHAVQQIMAHSLDASDRHAVAEFGAARAAANLFALVPQMFETRPGWWKVANDRQGQRVGFVLPVLFKAESRRKNGRPEGTILHTGVLPGCRGRGYGFELLGEATRTFIAADCWRIFCDTATDNYPMVNAFRRAGYIERTPWQRSVA